VRTRETAAAVAAPVQEPPSRSAHRVRPTGSIPRLTRPRLPPRAVEDGRPLQTHAECGDQRAVARRRERPIPAGLGIVEVDPRPEAPVAELSDGKNAFGPSGCRCVLDDATQAPLDQSCQGAARGGGFRLAVLSGGVAANSALRAAFLMLGERLGIRTAIPHLRFCTDNAAMIAAAADRQGESARADPLTLDADPNLPFVPPARSPHGVGVDAVDNREAG